VLRIASCNGRVRDECLNLHWFTTLADARIVIETWRREYNHVRPHSSLGSQPPAEFATHAGLRPTPSTSDLRAIPTGIHEDDLTC